MGTVQAKTAWGVDPIHSEILFKVKHLVISTVTGSFSSYDVKVETDGDEFEGADVAFTADIDSISTNNDQRDAHLKSADFFDAENHPKLSFTSTAFRKTGEGTFELEGNLTIRGNTHPVKLDVEYGGTVVDPYGQTKAGFELTGKINRKDFGLTWSATPEAGGVVVSDDVRLLMSVQLVKQS
jgi:polyisoprenoid-binding protein YceI